MGRYPVADAQAAFLHRLHKCNASSGRFGLKVKLHIGRTGTQAKAAMHASVKVFVSGEVVPLKTPLVIKRQFCLGTHG
jgi:hypothetical protein